VKHKDVGDVMGVFDAAEKDERNSPRVRKMFGDIREFVWCLARAGDRLVRAVDPKQDVAGLPLPWMMKELADARNELRDMIHGAGETSLPIPGAGDRQGVAELAMEGWRMSVQTNQRLERETVELREQLGKVAQQLVDARAHRTFDARDHEMKEYAFAAFADYLASLWRVTRDESLKNQLETLRQHVERVGKLTGE
jgi:hypothetical protein